MGGDHTSVPCFKGNVTTVMEHMGKLQQEKPSTQITLLNFLQVAEQNHPESLSQ